MFCNIFFLFFVTGLSMASEENIDEVHGDTYEENTKVFKIPIHNKYAIPIPYPNIVKKPEEFKVPIPVPQQVPFQVPQPVIQEVVKQVEIPVEKLEPYTIEKQVPFLVHRPHIVYVDKKFPIIIAQPHIVRVPVYRHVYKHSYNSNSWR